MSISIEPRVAADSGGVPALQTLRFSQPPLPLRLLFAGFAIERFMKPSVVTFARLPEEEAEFLEFLASTGDVWARAVNDDAAKPTYTPAPVGTFLQQHGAALLNNGTLHVWIGFRPDVLKPQKSKINEKMVVDPFPAYLVGYTRGEYYPGGELAQSNLYFYRGSFEGEEFVKKPETFLRWGAKVLAWVKKRTPEEVTVHRCNYKTRATARVAEAAADGLKVWY